MAYSAEGMGGSTESLTGCPMSPRPSRESDVLRMLSQGFDNPQIASRLGLSLGRVKNIVTAVLAKHGARDRKELRQMLENV